jgi:hypothetical protein
VEAERHSSDLVSPKTIEHRELGEHGFDVGHRESRA